MTTAVNVGNVTSGGGAPVVVQAMTNTDTSNAEATARQCAELAAAGAELVRIAVNTAEAAAAVPDIRRRLDDQGWTTPLIFTTTVMYSSGRIRNARPLLPSTGSIPATSVAARDGMRILPRSVQSPSSTAPRFASASTAGRWTPLS